MYWTAAVSFLSGGLMAYLMFRLYFKGQFVPKQEYDALLRKNSDAETKHAADYARLETELRFSEQQRQQSSADFAAIELKIEQQFRSIASAIIEEKSGNITETQGTELKKILDPLKEQIRSFKDEYEAKRTVESQERISLREQIRHMIDMNKLLSDQANNLATALRGNVKQQGNWGEMILESMLQYAGLQKGVQYFVQSSSKNSEGKTIQPDVLLKYPDERVVIVDAKVSLTAYEHYCAATDTSQQSAAAQLLVRSVKAHIDGLSPKNYTDIADALDFIIMFVPVEGAYIAAIQTEPALWQYAYNKKILLISPANLIPAMKLIADMWQRDQVNKQAHLIAGKAGRLYDKLALFVENFERVGSQLHKARETWDDAYKQLSKGKGNLVSQAEQLKDYGVKTGKEIAPRLTEQALLEDGHDPSSAV